MDITLLVDRLSELLDLDQSQLVPDLVLRELENWDSLTQVMLYAYVDEQYHLSLPTSELDKVTTFGDIVSLIQTKLSVSD